MEPHDIGAHLDALLIVDPDVIAPLHDPELGGDADFLSDVVQAFREDTPLRLAALREACADLDADSLVRSAHSLKGSSSNFGALRVQAICLEIERLGRDGDIERIVALLDRLDAEYITLLERLDQIIADAPPAC